jgi:dTDP-4-dehydrorhamnose 3,5-epimerase
VKLDVVPTRLPGCVELRPAVHRDARGSFVKVFHAEHFRALGLPTDWREEYWSESAAGVLRGLHFQTPPHAHDKLVYCTRGAVLDIALDLRRGSPTEGQHAQVELSARQGNALFLPAGTAHGFWVSDGPAVLVYKVTTTWAPEHDTGVRWDSAGIPWPDRAPLVSERDAALPRLADFASPFTFDSP